MKLLQQIMTASPLPKGVCFLDASSPPERVGQARVSLEKGLSVVWPLESLTCKENSKTNLMSDLMELVQRHDGKIFIFAPLLCTPRTRNLLQTVNSGELGVIAALTHQRTRARNAHALPDNALDLMLNDCAIMRRLFGRVSHVLATCASADGVEFRTACLSFENGVLGNITCHTADFLQNSFTFDCSGRNGNAVHSGNSGLCTVGGCCKCPLTFDEIEGIKSAWAELLSSIKDKTPQTYTAGEWLEDLKTISGIRASADGFKPQEVK